MNGAELLLLLEMSVSQQRHPDQLEEDFFLQYQHGNMEKILKDISKMKLCYFHHYPYQHYIDEDGCEIYNTALFVKESEQDWISGAPFSHNWIHFNRECCPHHHHHHCHDCSVFVVVEVFWHFLHWVRECLGKGSKEENGNFSWLLLLGVGPNPPHHLSSPPPNGTVFRPFLSDPGPIIVYPCQ